MTPKFRLVGTVEGDFGGTHEYVQCSGKGVDIWEWMNEHNCATFILEIWNDEKQKYQRCKNL